MKTKKNPEVVYCVQARDKRGRFKSGWVYKTQRLVRRDKRGRFTGVTYA